MSTKIVSLSVGCMFCYPFTVIYIDEKQDIFHTKKKMIFSAILYKNDHDLSKGRSRSLAFFKYKCPVESLFGISNYMNGNATVS